MGVTGITGFTYWNSAQQSIFQEHIFFLICIIGVHKCQEVRWCECIVMRWAQENWGGSIFIMKVLWYEETVFVVLRYGRFPELKQQKVTCTFKGIKSQLSVV